MAKRPSYNKERDIAYSKQWAKDNPEKYRYNQWKSSLKRYYGITVDDYNRLYEESKGCCYICNVHQLDLKIRLSVDHCHTTGTIRGLLCSSCNHGLGRFRDNTELLEKAIKYLKTNWS